MDHSTNLVDAARTKLRGHINPCVPCFHRASSEAHYVDPCYHFTHPFALPLPLLRRAERGHFEYEYGEVFGILVFFMDPKGSTIDEAEETSLFTDVLVSLIRRLAWSCKCY